MSNVTLIESVSSKPERIDREAGVIHGVLLLGRKSKNKNREYTESALQDAITRGLYENADINVDHPGKTDLHKNRPLMESWGKSRNPRVTEAGIIGDAHYLKTHPLTESILERAERFGDGMGFSHNALARKVTRKGGREFIEAIESVRSVDLVRNPATSKNLFESGSPMQTMTLKALAESLDSKNAGRKQILDALAGDSPIADGSLEVSLVESADDEAKLNAGLKALLECVCEGESPYADKVKMLAKFVKEDEEEPAEKVTESTLLESFKAMERKQLVRDLLDEYSISRGKLEPKNRDLLESQADEKAMRRLIESWSPAQRGAAKPAVKSARETGSNYEVSLPSDVKSFVAATR